jgi:hypothetical protein
VGDFVEVLCALEADVAEVAELVVLVLGGRVRVVAVVDVAVRFAAIRLAAEEG